MRAAALRELEKLKVRVRLELRRKVRKVERVVVGQWLL